MSNNPKQERDPLRTGVFGLVIVVCVVLIAFGYSALPFWPQGKTYEAYFTDAGGITPGNAVLVSGFKVGKVSGVSLAGDTAKITFSVDRHVVIGDQSLAAIRTDTILGERSISISPAGTGHTTSIPVSRTTTPYTLNGALEDLGQNANNLNRPQFEQALKVLTDTLHDATPQLRGALDGVTSLSETLNRRDEALQGLLAHAKGVTAVLSERAAQVDKLVDDGNQLFAALDERRAALSALISGIGDVSAQISGFVADNRKEFGPALNKLNAVLGNLNERRDYITEALKRLPTYATTLGEVVGSGPGFNVNVYGAIPAPLMAAMFDFFYQPGKLPDSLTDYLRGMIQGTLDHQAEVTMTTPRRFGGRGLRTVTIIALVAGLVGGAYVLFSSGGGGRKITAYFSSAVGIYPGDQVRVLGVPVGEIDSIEPRPSDVKITMKVSDDLLLPLDAKALIISPNLVAARFIQLTPVYTGGAVLPDGGSIDLARTAVPVEWDEVKEGLNKLAVALSPAAGEMQGPLGAAINQAAATLDGTGDSFHNALRELSQAAGRLGDSRSDIFGTVKNLQVLVDALAQSNEQIVQFAGHVASVSQVLADSSRNLDHTLGTLNQALSDIRGFLHENNSTLIDTVNQLGDLTQTLSDQSQNLEQVLHVACPGIANFYNIYDPAQGTLNGLISLPEFTNPVQFICGGSFETAGGPKAPDYFRRAEICRERLGPVLRRLTVNYPPIMFHPINTITAYKGQIIYDTPATQAKSEMPIPELTWIPANPKPGPPTAPTDLQSLLVPSAPGIPPGYGPLPGPAPAPAAGPAPGPLPAEQGAGG